MPTPELGPEQAWVCGRIEEVRAQLRQLAGTTPESRAQMKAERKRLYAALDDLLAMLWGQVPYESLISPSSARTLLTQITRRLKL